MYLYKKLDGEGKTRGTLTCSTPQPIRDDLVEIDKAEFDTIEDKRKADEKAAIDANGPSLKKRIEDLEADVATLKGT